MDLGLVFGLLGLAALVLVAWSALADLARGTPLERIRVLGGEGVAVADPTFCEMLEDHLNTELQEGCSVEVLFDGDGVYPRLFADLAAARSLILFHVFWFRPGELAERLRAVLEERARAGVHVLVLHDAWGARPVADGYWESLRRAGAEVHRFRPLRWWSLDELQRRSHIRAVVIDGTVGYTGGFAIADEWRGDGRSPGQWRDTSVRLEGPIVGQLATVFAAEWVETTGELLVGQDVFPRRMREPHGDQLAGILHEAPSAGSTEAERFFALSLAGARRRFWMTNAYFVPDDDFRRLFTDAVARGVDVRVLTPGRNTDQKVTWYAARVHYEELLAAGVRIYEYRPTMVHAKTLVADGLWSAVGSLNFDNRSMAINNEATALVYGETVARTLEERFRDDLERADELDLESFRRRGRWVRLRERAAVAVSRFI